MSIPSIEIVCDDTYKNSALIVPCGARLILTGATSVESAVQMASLAGWGHDTETGLDYCPTCSKLLDIEGTPKSNIDPTSTE